MDHDKRASIGLSLVAPINKSTSEVNERMIAEALIEARFVMGSRHLVSGLIR